VARHYNAATGDYLLANSIAPPSGYVYQATLGYLRPSTAPPSLATTYTRNVLGQVTQAANPNVTYTYTYDPAHRPDFRLVAGGEVGSRPTWAQRMRLVR
jgi:hypothetical protein